MHSGTNRFVCNSTYRHDKGLLQELQNIINSRGGNSSNSLLENFQKSVKEAAKLPAEILKEISPPTQPSTPAPAIPLPPPLPPIPVPITKALPQPDSKAAAASKVSRLSVYGQAEHALIVS